jgi:YD repeat-containing protein
MHLSIFCSWSDGPTEELTFTCAGAEWTWTEYDASGKVRGETHTPCDGLLSK